MHVTELLPDDDEFFSTPERLQVHFDRHDSSIFLSWGLNLMSRGRQPQLIWLDRTGDSLRVWCGGIIAGANIGEINYVAALLVWFYFLFLNSRQSPHLLRKLTLPCGRTVHLLSSSCVFTLSRLHRYLLVHQLSWCMSNWGCKVTSN